MNDTGFFPIGFSPATVINRLGFKIILPSSKSVYPDFTFSADNKRVLFAMTNPVDRKPQIYFIDREKTAPPQLLPGQPLGWKILNSALSPHGKQIAFTGEHIPQPVEWPIARTSARKE